MIGIIVDKVCGSVFSANKYKDFYGRKEQRHLAVMLSEMNDEIALIENNYERLKIKRDIIKEILSEKWKK